MTTSFTNIDENNFKIIFTTSQFKSEDPVESWKVSHSGFKWNLYTQAERGYLNISVECHGNESNLWSVEVKDEIKLIKQNGEPKSESSTSTFNSDSNWGSDQFIKLSELDDGYIDDGKITIEYIAEIKTIIGLQPKRMMNFQEKSELSDVELVADRKSFHVSKAVLGSFSPVFRAMFRPGFKESTAKTIPLEDVDSRDLDMFLQILYHSSVEVDEFRVEGLLKLADRYNVHMIIEKCEKFLIDTELVLIDDKLSLAELYKLSELQHSCLASMTTMKDVCRASSTYEDMGIFTAKALLKKSKILFDEK